MTTLEQIVRNKFLQLGVSDDIADVNNETPIEKLMNQLTYGLRSGTKFGKFFTQREMTALATETDTGSSLSELTDVERDELLLDSSVNFLHQYFNAYEQLTSFEGKDAVGDILMKYSDDLDLVKFIIDSGEDEDGNMKAVNFFIGNIHTAAYSYYTNKGAQALPVTKNQGEWGTQILREDQDGTPENPRYKLEVNELGVTLYNYRPSELAKISPNISFLINHFSTEKVMSILFLFFPIILAKIDVFKHFTNNASTVAFFNNLDETVIMNFINSVDPYYIQQPPPEGGEYTKKIKLSKIGENSGPVLSELQTENNVETWIKDKFTNFTNFYNDNRTDNLVVKLIDEFIGGQVDVDPSLTGDESYRVIGDARIPGMLLREFGSNSANMLPVGEDDNVALFLLKLSATVGDKPGVNSIIDVFPLIHTIKTVAGNQTQLENLLNGLANFYGSNNKLAFAIGVIPIVLTSQLDSIAEITNVASTKAENLKIFINTIYDDTDTRLQNNIFLEMQSAATLINGFDSEGNYYNEGKEYNVDNMFNLLSKPEAIAKFIGDIPHARKFLITCMHFSNGETTANMLDIIKNKQLSVTMSGQTTKKDVWEGVSSPLGDYLLASGIAITDIPYMINNQVKFMLYHYNKDNNMADFFTLMSRTDVSLLGYAAVTGGETLAQFLETNVSSLDAIKNSGEEDEIVLSGMYKGLAVVSKTIDQSGAPSGTYKIGTNNYVIFN